jgi:hypothetical protein
MRIYDQTDGCGHPMYARMSGKRTLYVCGRYMNGAGCSHNAIDGEAALRFALGVLRQRAGQFGGREALRRKLLAFAQAPKPPRPEPLHDALKRVEVQLRVAEEDLRLIERNFARARDDDDAEMFRRERQGQQAEVTRLRGELDEIQAKTVVDTRRVLSDPEQQAEQALALFDEIERLASDAGARAGVPELLEKLNLRMGLYFAEGRKGNRAIRVLQGGVIVTGETSLPVRPYGKSSNPEVPEGCGNNTDGSELPSPAGTGGEANKTPPADIVCRREGVSFRKVHRGDRIRTCGLLVPNQALYQAELRPGFVHAMVVGLTLIIVNSLNPSVRMLSGSCYPRHNTASILQTHIYLS